MKTKHYFKFLPGAIVLSAVLLSSCKKDLVEIQDEDAANTVARAVYEDRTVNWDNWTHGSTYTYSKAVSDFGNIEGFSTTEQNRSYISSGTLRIKLVKDLQDAASGVVTKININDHSAYEVTYSVKAHSAFDWAQKGGKLGWGFLIGDGFTGGDDATGGTGGSFRLVWWVSDSDPNNVCFKPYAYFVDQPGVYGYGWGKRYPAAGSSIERGVWYTVKLFAQANTYSNYNGKVKMTINGTVVYNNDAFRWTTVHSKRFINYLAQSNFRGGGTGSESSTDGYIYFDNFKVADVYAVY